MKLPRIRTKWRAGLLLVALLVLGGTVLTNAGIKSMVFDGKPVRASGTGDIEVQLRKGSTSGGDFSKSGIQIKITRSNGGDAHCSGGDTKTTNSSGQVKFENCDSDGNGIDMKVFIKNAADKSVNYNNGGGDRKWAATKDTDDVKSKNNNTTTSNLVYDTAYTDIGVQLKEEEVGGSDMKKGGVTVRVERNDGSSAGCENNEKNTDGNGAVSFANCDANAGGLNLRVKVKSDFNTVQYDGRDWIVAKSEDNITSKVGSSPNQNVSLTYDPAQNINVKVNPDFRNDTPLIKVQRADSSSAANDCEDGVTQQRTGQDGKVTFTCRAKSTGFGYKVTSVDPGSGRNWNGSYWDNQGPNDQSIQLYKANPVGVTFEYKVRPSFQCGTNLLNIASYDYIIPAPADCFPDNSTDDAGPSLNFLLSSGDNGVRSVTQGYVPNQFVVASSQPELNFQLRGGGFNRGPSSSTNPPFNAGDWGDTLNNTSWPTMGAGIKGYDSPIYYEVYQLKNMAAGDGNGGGSIDSPAANVPQRLGVINPRDYQNFPSADTHPASQTCSGGPCWRDFRITTAGGNITTNGADQQANVKDAGLLTPNFKGVNESLKFEAAPGANAGTQGAYPNYNGMYVFLIKQVHLGDLGHGYVSEYTGFEEKSDKFTTLCPVATSGNNVDCPLALLGSFWANVKPDAHYVRNAYYLRTPKNLTGGGRQFLSTAPANLTFDVGWGTKEQGQASFNPYGEYYGEPYRGLMATVGGAGCRNDNYSKSKSGGSVDSVYGLRITNNTNPLGGQYRAYWGPNTGADPQFWAANSDFGAQSSSAPKQYVFNPDHQIKETIPMSDNYDNAFGISNPNLDSPTGKNSTYSNRWMSDELQSARFQVSGWNMANELYYGGAQFSWGQQPTCYRPTMIANTPKTAYLSFEYNGTNGSTILPDNTVDSNLRFGFTYQLPSSPTTAAQNRTTNWTVEIRQNPGTPTPDRSISGTDTNELSGTQHVVADGRGQTAGLSGNYYWRACAKGTSGGSATPPLVAANFFINQGDTDEVWNCTVNVLFKVNQGPSPVIQNQAAALNGAPSVNYCAATAVQLNDPEGDNVTPRFTVAWTDSQGRANRVSNAERGSSDVDAPVGPTGSVFNTGQVNVGSYTINGANQSFNTSQTLADFIRQRVPSNTNALLIASGTDRYGASDLNAADLVIAQNGVANRADATRDISFSTGQDSTSFKWGPQATAWIRTAPSFNKPPATKTILNPANGQPFQNDVISDGQTVDVRLTLQNSGQTPMKRFHVIDYIGSVRDFETPTNFRFSFNGGATQTFNPIGGVQKVQPSSDHTQPQNDQTFNATSGNSREHGQAAYKFDYGFNGGGIMPAGELAPGQTLTFTYQIRANRNQSLESINNDANLQSAYDIGGTQTAESGQVELSAAYTYTEYQSDYCDNTAPLTEQVLDFQPGDVLSPSLQTQRGSVHSNSDITGYAGLSSNATYTVTANGDISQFTGQNLNEQYDASQRLLTGSCSNTPSDGLDWRRTMIQNVAALKAGPNTALATSVSGSLALGNGTVYQTPVGQGLTIAGNLSFSGVGTIVVNGDLVVNGNMSYTTPQSSVGFIVLGNLVVNPTVTQMVGSYYVSDVNYTAAPSGIDAATNCPLVTTTRGNVTVQPSANTFNMDGLMIARNFTFGRYYANPATATGGSERIYYDGRVLSLTPPGFSTFSRNTSWFEVAP